MQSYVLVDVVPLFLIETFTFQEPIKLLNSKALNTVKKHSGNALTKHSLNIFFFFFKEHGENISGTELHSILSEIDTNNNGQVELEEYLQVTLKK